MASRWLSPRQSAWGGAGSERTYSLQNVVVVCLIVLMAGGALGYALGGGKSQATTSTSSSNTASSDNNASAESAQAAAVANAKASPVIAPDVALLSSSEKSADGAVKAATAFVSGIPNVAFLNNQRQLQVLDSSISPTAPPEVRKGITDSLEVLRTQLQTAPGSSQARARMLITPASYRVEQGTPEQAKVSIWYLNVLLDATNQTVRSYWATSTIGLEWNTQWRVNQFDTKLGPAPQVFAQDSQFSSFADVRQVFDGYKAYRFATAP